VLAAAAKVREAYLALQRTRLIAPVDGYVAKRGVQLGQRVAAGSPLMTVVGLHQLWVDANFKESQLADLRIGQKAELTADVYGDKTVYHGKVVGLGAGTGAAFSLLPAQNATGNWIKVVQRVPVRISLSPEDLATPLRVGLSMDAKVISATVRHGPGRPRAPSRWHRRRSMTPPCPGRGAHRPHHRRHSCLPAPCPPRWPSAAAPAATRLRSKPPVPELERIRHDFFSTAAPGEARGRCLSSARATQPAGHACAAAPLKGAQLVLGTVALSLATFMNVLDSSIANVAIPAISGDVGVSPSQGTWVITSFGVANAISVPLTGWLTQRFGAVRLFTMSVLLFVLTSWLCGFAGSLEMLVLFRVLQGLVAGPMIPLSQTLLLSSYPPSRAGTALALWGMTTLVAPVVGPLLGGWITDNISWPWIFYINVPVGLLSAC
jgi:hypothetical protein